MRPPFMFGYGSPLKSGPPPGSSSFTPLPDVHIAVVTSPLQSSLMYILHHYSMLRLTLSSGQGQCRQELIQNPLQVLVGRGQTPPHIYSCMCKGYKQLLYNYCTVKQDATTALYKAVNTTYVTTTCYTARLYLQLTTGNATVQPCTYNTTIICHVQ